MRALCGDTMVVDKRKQKRRADLFMFPPLPNVIALPLAMRTFHHRNIIKCVNRGQVTRSLLFAVFKNYIFKKMKQYL
jgi:hypothetical protein